MIVLPRTGGHPCLNLKFEECRCFTLGWRLFLNLEDSPHWKMRGFFAFGEVFLPLLVMNRTILKELGKIGIDNHRKECYDKIKKG